MTADNGLALVGANTFAREGLKRVLQDLGIPVGMSVSSVQRADLADRVLIEEGGAEEVRAARAGTPHRKIMVLINDGSGDQAIDALDASADLVLSREATFESVGAAIQLCAQDLSGLRFGGRPAQASTASARDPKADQMFPRQREVLEYLSQGLSNAEIAERMGVVEDTVKIHLKNIFKRLETKNRVQVALWAAKQGFGEVADNTNR